MVKLVSISELAKELGLINLKTKKPNSYILRYWEKEFKLIRPTILQKRRYYDAKQIEIIKLIKYLLKEKGMTISGAKTILKKNINSLDDYKTNSLKADYFRKDFKIKTKRILEKIKKLKR